MRFFLAAVLSFLLVGLGIFLRGKSDPSFGLSVGHRSLQRLMFDEMNLRTNPQWRSQEVKGELDFAGNHLRVLMSALPTQGKPGLKAVAIEVDEDQGFEQREMILVSTQSVEATVMLRAPSPGPLAQGELIVNGKSAGEYSLFAHPFTLTLQNGEGPLARRGAAGIEVSRQSRRLPLLVELAQKHEKELPALDETTWAVWNPKTNEWRIWGHWPEGWSL
jgi:hypothetical protein